MPEGQKERESDREQAGYNFHANDKLMLLLQPEADAPA